MDPLYATSDPTQLYMTDSGFAMSYDPTTDPALVAPVEGDFGTMLMGTLQTFGQNLQRALAPATPGIYTTQAAPGGINLGSPTTLLLIGGLAYFLLRKR